MTLPEISEGYGVVFISIHSHIASRVIRLRFEPLLILHEIRVVCLRSGAE